MLDVHVIRANLDAVKANCRNRNVPAADPDLVIRLDDDRKRLVQEAQTLQQRANELSKGIPKETHPDAPVGTTAGDNKVITTWGERPKFEFKPRDHVALVEALDLADFE